jgi:archaemetzincin
MSDERTILRMVEYLEIALVPIGRVDPVSISWLKEDLPEILQAGVKELPPIPLSSRHFQNERNQYLADGILADFTSFAHSGKILYLGITETDLFSPGLNYIFGVASTGRALISTFRLRPEFYGGPSNPKVYRWRILTEAIHELGHAIGLAHCDYPGCVMYFSNWIGDTDRKGPKFCYQCRKRIDRLLEVQRELG